MNKKCPQCNNEMIKNKYFKKYVCDKCNYVKYYKTKMKLNFYKLLCKDSLFGSYFTEEEVE